MPLHIRAFGSLSTHKAFIKTVTRKTIVWMRHFFFYPLALLYKTSEQWFSPLRESVFGGFDSAGWLSEDGQWIRSYLKTPKCIDGVMGLVAGINEKEKAWRKEGTILETKLSIRKVAMETLLS